MSLNAPVWRSFVAAFAFAITLGLVTGCAPTPLPPPTPTIAAPADFPAEFYDTATGGSVYTVDPARSSIEIRVYRDGPLARFGHNHVITGAIEGRMFQANEFDQSRADLYVSVLDLVVDDGAARAAAGREFASEVDPDAIAGTRGNLLGPAVLDAAAHPHLKARVEPITASDRFMTTLFVRDHVAPAPIPINWQLDGDSVKAYASFEVHQSELGITPFSVMGGGLRVKDTIEIHIEVNATLEQNHP